VATPPLCANCGSPLKPNAKFCGTCGAQVVEVPDAAAVAGQLAATPATPPAAAPAAAVPAAPATVKRPLQRWLIPAAIVLFVIVGVSVALVLGLSGNHSSPSDDAQDDSSGGNGTSINADPSTSDPTASSSDSSSSAPAAPVDSTVFRSVSGNITCTATAKSLVCHQRLIKYTPPSQACAATDGGATVGLDASGVIWPCQGASFPGAIVENYDDAFAYYGYSCTIDKATGIRCTNPQGSGFTMEYIAGISVF
jgi:hypothetical protein